MKKYLRFAICALVAALSCGSAAFAQNGNITGVTFSSNGRPAAGVNIAVCTAIVTTGASVTSNIATLTFASNPITQGFVIGGTLTVSGFTGGDTYYNGSFTIAAVSASTISYALTHANASAGTNGAVYMTGSVTQACAAIVPATTDNTGNFSAPNPTVSDGLGNYTLWVPPGYYTVQSYGPTVRTSTYLTGVACVPANASIGCGGTLSGSGTANQVAYWSGTNVFAGSPNFLWNQGTQTFSLFSSTAATGGANQNSPTIVVTGNFWNGAASVADNWTFQIVEGAGSNPVSEYRVIGGSSSGGDLFHIMTAFTVDLAVNLGGTLNVQSTIADGLINGTVAYKNKGNTPATGGANTSTGAHWYVGEYWTGAASADDIWALEGVLGTGTNPTSTLTWTHSGSPGAVIASIPGIMFSCGTIAAAGACVPATSGNSHCFSGIATLGGGTSTITAIAPAFTSSSSYFVTTNDLTTPANSSKGVPASGSSITFTGTGTDNLSFIACGE